jgi:hypothetical protein
LVRRDGAAIRKQRIQEIAQFIAAQLHKHDEVPLSKTVSVLALKSGLTKDKIR